MSSFDETLARVLDPESVYWAGFDQPDDSAMERLVQLRIDVPPYAVRSAVVAMKARGWWLSEQPDAPDDPQQRLFFRRSQDLQTDTIRVMLSEALEVVYPIEGARLWTWIVVDDETGA